MELASWVAQVETEPGSALERRRRLDQLSRRLRSSLGDISLQAGGLARRIGSEQFHSAACACLRLVALSLPELNRLRLALLRWTRDRGVLLALHSIRRGVQATVAVVQRVVASLRTNARGAAAELVDGLSPSRAFTRSRRHCFASASPVGQALAAGNRLRTSFFEPLLPELAPFPVAVRVLLVNLVWNSLVCGILDRILAARLPFDEEGVQALATLVGALSSEWFPVLKRSYQADTLLEDRAAWTRVRGVLACLSGRKSEAEALGLGKEEADGWRALLERRTWRTVLDRWRTRRRVFVEPDLNSLAV